MSSRCCGRWQVRRPVMPPCACASAAGGLRRSCARSTWTARAMCSPGYDRLDPPQGSARGSDRLPRSEEHTSELQSRQYLVCRLLLEKKKNTMVGENRVDKRTMVYIMYMFYSTDAGEMR